LPRRTSPPRPQPALLFAGISEQQWQFLRLRVYDEYDSTSARALGVSPRAVEGWKRQPLFRAIYAMALNQPRLFAGGELLWRIMAPPSRAAAQGARLMPAGTLYARPEVDKEFARQLGQRQLAQQTASSPPPTADIEIPEQHRRMNELPWEMNAAERQLADALHVEHCVVLGYWNGQPSLEAWSKHERAVQEAALFSSTTRMPYWYPDHVVFTSAGLIVIAEGPASQGVRCPLKTRHRCPLVDRRGVNFGMCPYWDLALGSWLGTELPSERTPSPHCHRDFGIARLLTYVAAATRRGVADGWSAGFPVIAVTDDADRAYWRPRVDRWNGLILDPWHHIRIVDAEILIRAITQFRVAEIVSSEQRRTS
jgi:hypothetical protein